MNGAIKKVMNVIGMLVVLISIPVVMVSILLVRPTYGSYMGHMYDVVYWWRVLILTVAITCVVCRVNRRSQNLERNSVIMAVISVAIFCLVVAIKSRWGVVKLFDWMAGSNGSGALVCLIAVPIGVILLVCVYIGLGRFVAGKL